MLLFSSVSGLHEVVRNFLCEMISTVASECSVLKTREPKFKDICALFKIPNYVVNQSVLVEMQVKLPSPCKVLHLRNVIGKGSEVHVQPIDPITAFVLKHWGSVRASVSALDIGVV